MTRRPTAAENGSSPLARGLPSTERRIGSLDGIIPARAGFTEEYPDRGHDPGDHPRSRGVYRTRHHSAPEPGGSSPLARGLLAMAPILAIVRRIIPARAGFTLAPGVRARRLGGSSPLARGLRGPGRRESGGPADHPRSRGVYSRGTVKGDKPVGSSPLARGLRVDRQDISGGAGIIPGRRRRRCARRKPRASGDDPRTGAPCAAGPR